MRNTAGWLLPVPSAGTDPDDVPDHVGNFGDAVDAVLGSASGTFAGRPATGKPGQLYFITSGTNLGLLYRYDTTYGWQQVNIGAGVSGDSTTIGWGDTPSPGVAPRYAAADHRHGSQTNPVIAHVAAANPHPQYATAQAMMSHTSSVTLASGAQVTVTTGWSLIMNTSDITIVSGGFQVNTAGWYEWFASVAWNPVATGAQVIAYPVIAGAAQTTFGDAKGGVGHSIQQQISGHFASQLAAGTLIQIGLTAEDASNTATIPVFGLRRSV